MTKDLTIPKFGVLSYSSIYKRVKVSSNVKFFVWAYNEEENFVISRNELFLVQNQNGEYNCTTLIKTIISKLFLKYIWDSRNRYSLPNFIEAKENITSDLLTLVNSNISIRRTFNDSGLAQKFLQG